MTALPPILSDDTIKPEVSAFTLALKEQGFAGDIEVRFSQRLVYATDNSVYQQIPQAVIFPRSTEDMVLATELARKHGNIAFSGRGGGTGTNGQSLTPGVIVDTSKYMNQILELNLDEGWVRVQSGVVKDQLNDVLRPHGYFFSPDLSTSNRATIGGMVSTDASGQGSLVYGKTSDHVLGLTTVLANGQVLQTAPMSLGEATALSQGQGWLADILKAVMATCVAQREQILEKFPRLNRFLTGYDLEHAYDSEQNTIDLGRLITGAEGSLGLISEAKLSITPIPKHTYLINIAYADFESALRHAPVMIQAQATSVETIDSNVLGLAKTDIIWQDVGPLVCETAEDILGLNMVEYNAEDAADIADKLEKLEQKLTQKNARSKYGVLGYSVLTSREHIQQVYAMRKKAVGLLGKTKGTRKPIAFAEDTAVPPENLADFIMEYRALLDSYQLTYGMFGHVDAGVLHVRPALNLFDPADEQLMHRLSDEVVALVAKYGGLMWGEHGKGYRSQYSEAFFGEALYRSIRAIKAAFDPFNQMNPGKICTPLDSDAALVSVSDTKRAHFDKQIPVRYRSEFSDALNCNGNGLCFNYDTKSPMCPSFKVSGDRRFSPKGRATLMREWLRLLGQQRPNGSAVEPLQLRFDWRHYFRRTLQPTANDFSHEVLEAMDSCLACKSCASQCPVNVNIPELKSRFLHAYHSRYLRPMRDYVVAYIELIAPLTARVPRLVNRLLTLSLSQRLFARFLGYQDLPLLSYPTLRATSSSLPAFDAKRLAALSDDEKRRHVLIVQDPFTSFYDASVVQATIEFMRKLGLEPIILPYHPNGKPQHVKGFLNAFRRTATKTAKFLSDVAQLGIPMVGCDASTVLCLRDEYRDYTPASHQDFAVLTLDEWIGGLLGDNAWDERLAALMKRDDAIHYRLLGHCSEKTAVPSSTQHWLQLFERLGLRLHAQASGCCGMAGTYGHETHHVDDSIAIYRLSWQPIIEQARERREQVLATGFSCRSQVKRLEHERVMHPIEVLAAHIG